jgi:hypothetical protein
MDEQRLMEIVEQYHSMGIHRTGTDVDYATSDWLSDCLESAGLETRRQTWNVRQYFLKDASVEVGSKRLDAFPIWYSPSPRGGSFSGRMGLIDDPVAPSLGPQDIGFVPQGVDRRWWQRLEAGAIRNRRVGAVLAVSNDPSPLGMIVARNVEPSEVGVDLPIPVIQVRSSDIDRYERAMAVGEEVTIRLRAECREATPAHNVMGVKRGGDQWIVISTPSSGWFTCAGERGPGIALFLALASWVGAQESRHSYLFTANSGHELGFWGARQLHLGGHLPRPEETRAWLHLGASIATPSWRERDGVYQPDDEMSVGLLQATDKSLVPTLEAAFRDLPALRPRVPEHAVGELANVAEHGYRGFGLVSGGNIHFHTKDDSPVTVSGKSLVQIYQALELALAAI